MSPARLAELLALHDAEAGVLIATGPGRRVTHVRDGPDDVAVKTFTATGLRRVARALLGSRADRAARAADRLRASGLGAPEVAGVLEEPGRSVLVTRWVDGLDLQAALGVARREDVVRLAVAATTFAARLHGAGLACRDLKPPNLVVRGWSATHPPDAPIDLVLVDLEDVARAGPRATRGRWRNLAALDAYGQLVGEPLGVRARAAALQAYATTSGLDAREVLQAVLPRSREKRRSIRARALFPGG